MRDRFFLRLLLLGLTVFLLVGLWRSLVGNAPWLGRSGSDSRAG